ncbi:MAG: metallopeptidase TldD-related protein, partial [Legionellaceae bacterium]
MRHLPEHTNSSIAKSSQYLSDLMEDVLLRAKKQGATEATVAANHDEGFSVNVRMGEVETVAFSEEKGIGITVYIGQQKGSASSSDRSEAALDAMVAAAMDIARVSAADPCFGLPDKALMQNTYPDLDLCHPWSITPEHAIAMAKTCEAEALRLDQRITNSDGVSVSSYNFCSGYASSQGFLGVVPGSRHSVSCSLIAKENDIMQRDYDYTNSRRAEDLLSLDALAASVVERTTSRLGARQLKTQKSPVLFSSRVSSGLFSSLIQAISGANLYKKNSFLLNSLGEMLFPSFIQVYEQPHLLGALGSSPFDAEGVVTRDNTFI